MFSSAKDHNKNVTAASKVDGAVGVQKKNWYVAIVNNRSERQCAKRLDLLGYETYVPVQTETHLWRNGMKKVVDRIILPAVVFIHTTDAQRRGEVVRQPYIKRFMTNLAGKADAFGRHEVAVVPDNQIQRLKFILGHADAPVEFEQMSFRVGDKVRVMRGGLMGMEGHIIKTNENNGAFFVLRIDYLGLAKVKVKEEDLEYIKE